MRIAMFASLLGVEATGQSMVVASTASHLAAAGHSVTVIATDCGYQGRKVSKFVPLPPEVTVRIFPAVGTLNRKLYRSAALIRWVREHVGEFDVLDVQGMWSVSGLAIARIFRKHGKPYLLTPHGTMTRYDWRKNGLKRRLFWMAFGDVWQNADAIRFTSTGEGATSYHPASRRGVVIPNGISLDAPPSPESRVAARAALGLPPDALMMLFLGRIAPQKGVKETLAAFEVAAQQLPQLRLYLVGPADDAYGAEVLASVQSSPVRERIVATGPIFGEAKNEYFRAADAFITLSHNEGMSIAHLEALSHGLPMVLTESSNLDHLQEYGAGVLTTHDASQGGRDIVKLMADPVARANASRQARRLIEEKFSWDRVVPQLTALYEELVDSKRDSREETPPA